MLVLRSFVAFGILVALTACQTVTPPTELSALELADGASVSSYSESGGCANGSVKVCAKEFTAEPFTCECVDETKVRPIWNR
jgi:hypothetical protein